MTVEKQRELLSFAKKAREKSYSLYSGFSVGAALLCDDGTIFEGANIETAAYVTNCAERTALYSAIFAGKRDFTAIAVYGRPNNGNAENRECYPCGVCRQVMAEFCGGDFLIIVADENEEPIVKTLDQLLPFRFSKDNM